RNEERVQVLAVEVGRLHFANRGAVDERAAVRQLSQLAGEAAGAVLHDGHRLALHVAAAHAHLARLDEVGAAARLAAFEEALAVGIRARLAEAAHALHVLGIQCRERLGASRLERGRREEARTGLDSRQGSISMASWST